MIQRSRTYCACMQRLVTVFFVASAMTFYFPHFYSYSNRGCLYSATVPLMSVCTQTMTFGIQSCCVSINLKELLCLFGTCAQTLSFYDWFSYQLLKIGFDEETSQMDTKNLFQQIENLRHPSKITIGLKHDPTSSSGLGPEASLSLAAPHPTERVSGVVSGLTSLEDLQLAKNKNSVWRKNIGTYVRMYMWPCINHFVTEKLH